MNRQKITGLNPSTSSSFTVRSSRSSFLSSAPFSARARAANRLSRRRCGVSPSPVSASAPGVASADSNVSSSGRSMTADLPRRSASAMSAASTLSARVVSVSAAAAETLTTRADNVDAEDIAEAERLGRSAVMDLPDEETFESADATPGADADTGDGDTPHRRRLKRFAARARALKGADDKKLLLLERTVKELLVDGFNPVIFCRFIDTAEYVAEHLKKKLGGSYEVDSVTGTLPPDERMSRIEKLAKDGAKRPVLVATDCLSEGVNLQDKFQAVVHYDLAWNPTRHEQREGRVDRFNQAARTVRAVTIYGADNGIDGIVLNVLLRKHEQIRKALGISVPVPDRSDDVMEAILEGCSSSEGTSDLVLCLISG